ncbi:hypothetical protein QCA50_008359 [Cerrena zonata]|uniref:Potassium transport protein n=1 Tax=Cerrena zonata TaxID=2478898 RepID=A0AAW0G8R0_9APHY
MSAIEKTEETQKTQSIRQWLKKELNFFRVHLLFFLIVPLISSVIFWAANGRFHVRYIDALFVCYSALTVTGLSTINLSTCTVFQQAILFFLMCIGNVTVVAWVMVLIRKRYFRRHLQQKRDAERFRHRLAKRVLSFAHMGSPRIKVEADPDQAKLRIDPSKGIGQVLAVGTTEIGLGIGMGKAAGQVSPNLDPTGSTYFEGSANQFIEGDHLEVQSPTSLRESSSMEIPHPIFGNDGRNADHNVLTSSPRSDAIPLPQTPTSQRGVQVQYQYLALPHLPNQQLKHRTGRLNPARKRTVLMAPVIPDKMDASNELGLRGKDQGNGGFPGPIQVSMKFARRYFPKMAERLENLLKSTGGGKSMKQLQNQFSSLIIGRNSHFNTDELTDEELEELGGLEYRALRLLSYLVAFYFIGIQLVALAIFAPWLSTSHEYDEVFEAQPRVVNKTWFAAFQVLAAYTGGGMSLVDAGMVPFQKAYLMIFPMIFTILAGNHGLPIFIRLSIWILTKFVKDDSEADQTLHFLLDHPRRCFLYLFPSHVTWFLTATLITFTAIEWASFIVLDIGLEVTDSLPTGTRVVAGLFQSLAVRASGFSIVSLASLAPAFQFLCIIMMYIAVYPVGLSIRSTNVYEEQSLGVFELPAEDEEEEPHLPEQGSRRERIGKYFGWHLRRQVAYDIWWLVWGIFLICIIERTKILDEDNAPWFNVFRIVFELVSAFGGIGLTLGIPTENFSFSGSFGPLSKLVVIVIMLRGRHRGLPVAVDRAIMLPEELVPPKPEDHSKDIETGKVDNADIAEKGEVLNGAGVSPAATLHNDA